eukprot:PLAT7507.1.p1 GENE.PLAT7507.1~~PLAT7507.1.p1  ORF type:complete len:397 (-),score=104.15 PLAT7507.1:705-1895(-)
MGLLQSTPAGLEQLPPCAICEESFEDDNENGQAGDGGAAGSEERKTPSDGVGDVEHGLPSAITLASVFCMDCKVPLCQPCARRMHRGSAFRRHLLLPPCTQHPATWASLICVSDLSPICSRCESSGEHSRCKIKSIRCAAKPMREEVQKLAESVRLVSKLGPLLEAVKRRQRLLRGTWDDEFPKLVQSKEDVLPLWPAVKGLQTKGTVSSAEMASVCLPVSRAFNRLADVLDCGKLSLVLPPKLAMSFTQLHWAAASQITLKAGGRQAVTNPPYMQQIVSAGVQSTLPVRLLQAWRVRILPLPIMQSVKIALASHQYDVHIGVCCASGRRATAHVGEYWSGSTFTLRLLPGQLIVIEESGGRIIRRIALDNTDSGTFFACADLAGLQTGVELLPAP